MLEQRETFMKVEGLTAVITGGASGLGHATAAALVDAGANVALLDIEKQRVDDAAGEIGCLGFECDVTDDRRVAEVVAEISKKLGGVRINVNCAGVAGGMLLVDKNGPVDIDSYRRIIEINLIGTVSVMTKCAAQMMAAEPLNEDNERGVVINTSSITAYEGMVGQGAYAASKGAIASLCLPVAREFAPRGVRVMAIAPGLFETPIVEQIPDEVVDSMVAKTQFPARMGSPKEFADTVLSICRNPMFNGTTLRLDGAVRLEAR